MRRALVLTALTGCTLSAGGPSPQDPAARGPIGRTFVVERALVMASDCGAFAELERMHEIEVEAQAIYVDGAIAAGPVIRPGPARQSDGGAPNLAFVVFESWSAPGVGTASPLVQYDLWVDGSLVTGTARTSFPPDCAYRWEVTGF
jgi:hypothetical protein